MKQKAISFACSVIVLLAMNQKDSVIYASNPGFHIIAGQCNVPASASVECLATGLRASSIKETKASLGFQVKGAQVIELGVCYSTSKDPGVNSAGKVTGYQGEPKDVPIPVSYKLSVTGLAQETKYYARAYVMDSKKEVCYSEEIEFTTLKDLDLSYMLNGPKVEKYPNGMVMKKYNLKDGQIDGVYEVYSDSGYILSKQAFKNGVPEGTLTTYYRDGKKQSVCNFRNGMLTGSSAEYYPYGNLKNESESSGEPPKTSGITKGYYDEGGLAYEVETQAGEFAYSINYDKQGRVTSEMKQGLSISYSYDNDGWKHTSRNGEKCTCSRCNE